MALTGGVSRRMILWDGMFAKARRAMENSKIGWTTHTMNFWWGCHRVSEECRHCYIDSIMRRAGREPFNGPMRTSAALWKQPFRWHRNADVSAAQRLRVFTCSMSDFFHPGADCWRNEAWQVIKDCHRLDWLILTKRPELIPDRLPSDWGPGYPNVWLGVTAGCRKSLSRLSVLNTIPARLRFLSAEPLLERLDLRPHLKWLDWVITGCENAHKTKRRPLDSDWVRDVDQQCRDAGIPHFFKQRYDGTRLVFDGLLDGRVAQQVPPSRA